MTPVTSPSTVAAFGAGSCRQPGQPLSVDQAHQVMQQHLRCPTGSCPARRAALTVLTAAGRYTLAAA